MAWVSRVMAGMCEVMGVMMMNKWHQERTKVTLLLLAAAFSSSFFLLSYAMETLPMGTAYAVWTGIGAAGGAIAGMVLYGESKNIKRIICIAMVLGATIGLKLVG